MARLSAEPEVAAVRPFPNDAGRFEVDLREPSGDVVTGTVDVTNIHGRLYVLRNDEDRTGALDNLAKSILATVRRPPVELDHIFANVRFSDEPFLGPEERSPTHKVAEPLAGDLAVVYQLDTPSSLVGLSYEDLGETPLEVWRRAARENIAREFANVVETPNDNGVTLYQLAGNEALTPAIVLTDAFWDRVSARHKDGALLILRQRDEVVTIDRNARDALALSRSLIEVAKQRGVDFLSDTIFERRDGKIFTVEE